MDLQAHQHSMQPYQTSGTHPNRNLRNIALQPAIWCNAWLTWQPIERVVSTAFCKLLVGIQTRHSSQRCQVLTLTAAVPTWLQTPNQLQLQQHAALVARVYCWRRCKSCATCQSIESMLCMRWQGLSTGGALSS